MADPLITVKGLDRLVRDLKKISPDIAQELKSANREMAESLVPVAKSKTPRNSGRLAESVRAGATQKSGVVRAGKKAVPYAGPIHFGWPARRISPNPFLWEALDSRRSEIESEYIKRISDIVDRVG